MNQNFKLGLTIVVSVIIGMAAFQLIQNYVVMKQIEGITKDMTNSLNRSAEKNQQRMQKQRVESARIKAQTDQRNLEKNLLCAKNVDTNKCTCYDKRDRQVVNMSVQQCNAYVEQQSTSYQ